MPTIEHVRYGAIPMPVTGWCAQIVSRQQSTSQAGFLSEQEALEWAHASAIWFVENEPALHGSQGSAS